MFCLVVFESILNKIIKHLKNANLIFEKNEADISFVLKDKIRLNKQCLNK